MLNTEARTILKEMVAINNSMIVAPTMTGCDEFKGIIFKLNLDQVDPDIKEFGIFDSTSFLQAMDLLDDPTITLNDNVISAKDANTTIDYITSTPSSLDYIDIPTKNIDTTVAAESILEFGFGTDIINKIKKAKSVFKTFDTLFITNNDGKVNISIGNENTFSKNNNSWSTNIAPTLNTNKDFTIAVTLDSVMKLPVLDLVAKVKYNTERDTYRLVLMNDLITFVLNLKT